MAKTDIKIGSRRIGAGAPVYFIAEAGSNHDRNFDQAKRLIDVAAEAGADAVKFQAFKAESLYPRRAGQSAYLKEARSIYDVIRDLEMPLEWIPSLAELCAARGLHFLCTPFDFASADVLDAYVPAFKIASYDMTNYPLLQHVARKGKPLIVSTGTADRDEVRDMIAVVRAVGDPGLVVLQCTAKYPAPLSTLNVRTVATMAELGVLTGLSDHSREPLPGPLAAVALRAAVIEKHFTLSNALPGPDHPYALEPHELADLIIKIRELEASLGSGEKVVQPEEQELRAFARRTIFTTRSIAAGERIRRPDLALLRCGKIPFGLHPQEYLRLFGRVANRALELESAPRAEDISPLSLETGEVVLRLLERRDAVHIFDWRAASEGSSLHPDPGARHLGPEGWFEQVSLRSDRLDFTVERRTAGPLGVVGLRDVDLAADRAELELLFSAAGRRDSETARQAARLVVRHAFEALGLRELRLSIVPDDSWMQDLAYGLGFVPIEAGVASPTEDGSALVSLSLSIAPRSEVSAANVITTREATFEDARYVWTVNNHPTTRAQSLNTADIPWETHVGWYRSRLARPDCGFLIGLLDGAPVGVARYDVVNGEAVVSLAVSAEYRGRGVGTQLIRAVTRLALARSDVRRAVAYTRPGNVASRCAFLGSQYIDAGEVELSDITMSRLERGK
jgi:sialic acid synthase SpsE/RimJ/RimL family protein N-acetyltransferase